MSVIGSGITLHDGHQAISGCAERFGGEPARFQVAQVPTAGQEEHGQRLPGDL